MQGVTHSAVMTGFTPLPPLWFHNPKPDKTGLDRKEKQQCAPCGCACTAGSFQAGLICSPTDDSLQQRRGTKVQVKARICHCTMQLYLKVQGKMAAGLDTHTGCSSTATARTNTRTHRVTFNWIKSNTGSSRDDTKAPSSPCFKLNAIPVRYPCQ